jgi:peptidoglycan-associated lipoprotein
MSFRNSIVLIGLTLTIGACADEKRTAASANDAKTQNASNPKPEDDATRGNLKVSDDIRKACGLTDAEAYFAFDSAHVRPSDQTVLKKIAECFSSGALKGREMLLVGHADPRGSADYNLALGGNRADNVKSVFASLGMSTQKIATSSRGAMDASGTEETSWSKDRRVDASIGE